MCVPGWGPSGGRAVSPAQPTALHPLAPPARPARSPRPCCVPLANAARQLSVVAVSRSPTRQLAVPSFATCSPAAAAKMCPAIFETARLG